MDNPGDLSTESINDFLKVQLEDSPREVIRKELAGMLEPTKELVKDVMSNNVIKSGLDDPEVMLAVQEIAANPDSVQKHKNNPKVAGFYSQLGKLMSDKINTQESDRNSKNLYN